MAEMKPYKQKNIDEYLFKNVKRLADKIRKCLNKPEISKKIKEVNKPGTKSQKIQKILESEITEMGFEPERKDLIEDTRLRPDFFKEIDSENDIFLEVERGRTKPNNMDLLDLWKCHISKKANFLFLLVPIEIERTRNGKQYKEEVFKFVEKRMEYFFSEDNYVNVKAVFLFGY